MIQIYKETQKNTKLLNLKKKKRDKQKTLVEIYRQLLTQLENT